MSLVGFKGQNHPQQVSKRGAKPEVDNLETPWEFFEPLNERFGFTLDVAALPHNAKCRRYFAPEDDGLAQDWSGERVWCNPPYSQIEPWVEKAWSEWEGKPFGPELIVMLLPANRTEQGWWQRHVEPHRDRAIPRPFKVEFLPGRLRFIKHGHDKVEPNQRPPFGCCLLIWGEPLMPATALKVIDGATGEITEYPGCPQCDRMQAESEEMDRKFKGLLLENRKLKHDKLAEVMAAPERPFTDLIHSVWKVACHRRRDLDFKDYERINYQVKRHGLAVCLRAVAGAAFDPTFSPPRKNGKRKRHDDLELIFRDAAHVLDFADRVPEGYEPNVERVAELGGVSVEWVQKAMEGEPK